MLTAMLKTQESDAFKDTNGKMDIQLELGWSRGTVHGWRVQVMDRVQIVTQVRASR